MSRGGTTPASLANEQRRALYARRRQDGIEQLGGVCVHCGTDERLTFDHVDPSTKTMRMDVALMSRWEIREAELALCQLLCASCHGRKTNADRAHRRKLSRRDVVIGS